MKKVLLFIGAFIAIFFGLQIASGAVLTALYTPNVESAWKASPGLTSYIELAGTNFPLMTLVLLLITAGIALGVTKLVTK